jgi:hypothetical protein
MIISIFNKEDKKTSISHLSYISTLDFHQSNRIMNICHHVNDKKTASRSNLCNAKRQDDSKLSYAYCALLLIGLD